MEPKENLSSTSKHASKIAAAYHAITSQDRQEEDVRNHDLDRAFEEIVKSQRSRSPAPDADAGDSRYECPKCGHANPGKNQFCGKCGAAHDTAVIAPARRATDQGTATLHLMTPDGVQHHHHYYHHDHIRSTRYLLIIVLVLLCAIAWQAGWQYGTRVGAPPAISQPLPVITTKNESSPPSPATSVVPPERSVVAESRASDTPASVQDPYPNELQGFKFYAKYLAPLRPGISRRAAGVRVLGDGTQVVVGWNIMPAYTVQRGSPEARLTEIAIRPQGMIPMGAVRFPATFAHCPAAIAGMDVPFDVYSDASGLEYWLYGEDSKWGRKGDLFRIVYAPTKRHC